MRLVRYTYPTFRSPAGFAGNRGTWAGLENEIDRLFQTVAGEFVAPTSERFAVDLYADKENLYVRTELPGVDRNALTVEVVDDQLTITAAAKADEAAKEQPSASFSRSVTIPESVQPDKVTAQYQDGVLTVTLPKKEEAKPRKIAVAVS